MACRAIVNVELGNRAHRAVSPARVWLSYVKAMAEAHRAVQRTVSVKEKVEVRD